MKSLWNIKSQMSYELQLWGYKSWLQEIETITINKRAIMGNIC